MKGVCYWECGGECESELLIKNVILGRFICMNVWKLSEGGESPWKRESGDERDPYMVVVLQRNFNHAPRKIAAACSLSDNDKTLCHNPLSR